MVAWHEVPKVGRPKKLGALPVISFQELYRRDWASNVGDRSPRRGLRPTVR
jgi:hypothetical protein